MQVVVGSSVFGPSKHRAHVFLSQESSTGNEKEYCHMNIGDMTLVWSLYLLISSLDFLFLSLIYKVGVRVPSPFMRIKQESRQPRV